jgi:hypothetical protein
LSKGNGGLKEKEKEENKSGSPVEKSIHEGHEDQKVKKGK